MRRIEEINKRNINRISLFVFFSIMAVTAPLTATSPDLTAAPSVEQLAKGEGTGWLPPTIEDLTGGKIKIGDLVNKENVDIVKEYLSATLYECVKKGMVLRMAENLPPEKIVPKYFWEATAKNKGMAVIDSGGIVYHKNGSPWPGGLPFPDPQTPQEAMANVNFGHVLDDFWIKDSITLYVNKNGEIEKTGHMSIWSSFAFGRLLIPPLGSVPGYEDIQWRHIAAFNQPLEMKGMGQMTIRTYDDNKPDSGFMYIPAFRRTIRVSATTYQDNVGGQDYTFSDPQGLREPFGYWDFNSMKKAFMLMPAPKNPFPYITEDGKIHPEMEFDNGHSFPRIGWAITPVIIIDATPKVKHIYGKKVMYMPCPPYWASFAPLTLADIYDQQGQMWKCYVDLKHLYTKDGIDYGNMHWGLMMYDLQTGHSSVNPWAMLPNMGVTIEELNLTKLLQMGK